jgi:hypothetical protein
MKQSGTTQHRFGRGIARAASLVLVLLFVSSFLTPVFAQYKRTDLVSNQPGVAPTTDEQHLVNAWGLTALPRSPFWVSDNGTGFSTLYSGAGRQIPLFVTIAPAPSSPPGTLGTATGTVGNISPNATDFTVTENGKSGRALFISRRWTARSAAGIPELTALIPTLERAMPLSRPTDRTSVRFTPAWLSLQIEQDKLSYMPPMMAPIAELTSLLAHLVWCSLLATQLSRQVFRHMEFRPQWPHLGDVHRLEQSAGWLCGHF